MKKMIALILVLVMSISLSACSNNSEVAPSEENQQEFTLLVVYQSACRGYLFEIAAQFIECLLRVACNHGNCLYYGVSHENFREFFWKGTAGRADIYCIRLFYLFGIAAEHQHPAVIKNFVHIGFIVMSKLDIFVFSLHSL